MGTEDAKKEAKEPRRGANLARPQEGQNGRDGAPHPASGGGERAAGERDDESESTQREIVRGEHYAAQRSRGAVRPGGPTTGSVEPSAEGGAPGGARRGAPAAGDVSPLADILAHLDSDEYLDTLNQLAESLLQEIDAAAPGAAQDEPAKQQTRQCSEGAQVVGPAAEHLEPSGGEVLNVKHDVDRILSQHSYAHPYTDKPETQVKEEVNNDKGDIFYANCDEENDCVTIEVPCDEQTLIEEIKPVTVKTDFDILTSDYSDIMLEKDMALLSPMSLSPQALGDNNLAVSPSHTSISDLGYESLASPLSETESMDLSDFWCESFSELFPGLV